MKGIAALLLLLLLATGPAGAQTNPFTGAPAPSPAPAAQPAEPPGFFAQLSRDAARFQRDTTREMSLRMRAIRDGETPFALVVGIWLAFLYGVIHAAGPGHGKAVVVGYFLTRQARIGRGLLMGLQISVGHVVSAIVIALVADLVFRTVWGTAAAEIRWIQLASYALIVLIGAYMIVETARGGGMHSHEHCTIPGHDHSHEPHGHSHGHDHEHRPQRWLSLGVGIVPCTGAILVMLYALANGILFAGFVLVAAIAAGMALTMAGLGVLAIVARSAMTRWTSRPEGERGPLAPVLDYAGGVVITLIGLFLFLGAY